MAKGRQSNIDVRESRATSIAAEFQCVGINDAASVILTNPTTPGTHKERESHGPGRYITYNQEQAIAEAMAIALANQQDHIESVRVSRDKSFA